jgi:hypothetical protein
MCGCCGMGYWLLTQAEECNSAPSSPGLTRGSLGANAAADARVKPGHDDPVWVHVLAFFVRWRIT